GTRRLQPQLRVLVAAALAAGAWPLFEAGLMPDLIPVSNLDPVLAIIWGAGIGCAIAAAYQAKYHRFAALILIGGAGLSTCITFVWCSAPDLARTQLVVEVVTTVLILLGLRWLPKRIEEIDVPSSFAARLRRHRDFLLALACGMGITVVSYAVMTSAPPPTV